MLRCTQESCGPDTGVAVGTGTPKPKDLGKDAAPNTLLLTVPRLLCRRLPVVVLQDRTVGTVMVVVLIQILDYSALNMVSYFAARSCSLIWYTSRITSVIRFRSGHKEARTRRALKIVGFQVLKH